MITLLYINEQLADLTDDGVIGLTFQVNDLADLKDRQSTFSNDIELPNTTINRKIFGFLDNINFAQSQPYQQNVCKLIQNGIETIPMGFAIVKSASAGSIKVQVVSGLKGLADAIDKKTISDLDLSDQNHAFNPGTIAASFARTDGYIYPILNYGNMPIDNRIVPSHQYFRPGIYHKTLVKRIVNEAGYKAVGKIFNDPFYQNEIIPFTKTLFGYLNEDGEERHYGFNDVVDMKGQIEDFSQKDFLKDWMQRYCLTPIVDNFSKTVTFYSFAELYTNKSKALDFTQKIIRSDEDTSFVLGNYGQVNSVVYAEDTGVQKGYGDGSFLINNKNLQPTYEAFKSIFSASMSTTALSGLLMASMDKYDVSTNDYSKATNPRVLYVEKVQGLNINIAGTVPTVAAIAYFTKATAPGLGYDELLTRYYGGLMIMLQNFRKETVQLKLTERDIYTLDHFIPIYDADKSCYYYINSIKNWIPGEPCTSEIIKM